MPTESQVPTNADSSTLSSASALLSKKKWKPWQNIHTFHGVFSLQEVQHLASLQEQIEQAQLEYEQLLQTKEQLQSTYEKHLQSAIAQGIQQGFELWSEALNDWKTTQLEREKTLTHNLEQTLQQLLHPWFSKQVLEHPQSIAQRLLEGLERHQSKTPVCHIRFDTQSRGIADTLVDRAKEKGWKVHATHHPAPFEGIQIDHDQGRVAFVPSRLLQKLLEGSMSCSHDLSNGENKT